MKTSREYQREIDAWAKHNFTYIDKIGYGMIEELGEYCHAILKSKQGIRRLALRGGVKVVAQEATFKWKKLEPLLKDAIGDALIFTLHWAEANETFISFDEVETYIENWKDRSENHTIGMCLSVLAQLFFFADEKENRENNFCRTDAQRVFGNFALLAKSRGWDWKIILHAVWDKVSRRDWVKFPTNGTSK